MSTRLQERKERIARGAASEWCKCYQCNCKLPNGNIKDCHKPNATCDKWYNAYSGALLALDEVEEV